MAKRLLRPPPQITLLTMAPSPGMRIITMVARLPARTSPMHHSLLTMAPSPGIRVPRVKVLASRTLRREHRLNLRLQAANAVPSDSRSGKTDTNLVAVAIPFL